MKTELLKKADEVIDEKGNHILVSKQKLFQDNGSVTEHYVCEKYKTSDTGVPQSKPKVFWVPAHMIDGFVSAIKSLK